ncbi:MAG: ribbon-helix-helix domain-containing protein [Myxococcaceae bacterium]
MPIMTLRLSRRESARVATLAKRRKVTRSELVRQAISQMDKAEKRTALDDLADLVGVIRDGPRDLATNPKHMKGFGR